jgi:preprotein translocase subunit SecD
MRVATIFYGLIALLYGSGSVASAPVLVDLAISCNDSTAVAQQNSLTFKLHGARDGLCLDESTFVRGLEIANAKVWKDERANVWWLIVQFADSATPVVSGVTSRAMGRELALVRGGKIISSGLVFSVPSKSQYAVTTESEVDAQKMLDALR